MITNTAAAPIYNFYEIEKSFPETYNNVIVAEGQRVIPIYVCKPICRYVESQIKSPVIEVKAVVPTAEEGILEELRKIDEMVVEIVKAPTRLNDIRSKQPRKSKPVPTENVSDGFIRIREAKISFGATKRKREENEAEETPIKKPKMDLPLSPPSSMPIEAQDGKPENIETMPNSPQPSSLPLEPLRSTESPEKEPQFACDQCDKRFYLKRAMLRHMYSHK